MTRLNLLWVTFVLLTGSCKGLAPELDVRLEWVFEMPSNATYHPPLVITCTGYSTLNWVTAVPDDYFAINETEKNGKFYSILTVESPIYEDTGNFTCYNEENESASSYVYIDDGTHAFVSPAIHQTVDVSIGQEILLDCRTTNPKIKVSVYKNNIQNVTNRFEVDAFYRFRKVAESLQETGMYACKENRNLTESTWLVTIEPQTTLAKPSIEKHRNSYHVVGVEFSLNCTIPINEGDEPIFKWEAPNLDSNPIVTRIDDESYSTNIFAISTLTIQNPSTKDSGTYTCIVSQGNDRGEDFRDIEVQEFITPFARFETNSTRQPFLFVKEGKEFQWVLYFTGFPDPLQYEFRDPFKKKLTDRKKSVSTSYVYEEGKLVLNIKNVSASDFGNYSAVLKTSTGELDEVFIILIVNATPKVDFGKVLPLFKDDDNVSLTAYILAFTLSSPRPIVSWYFNNDCPEGIGSCNTSNGILLSHDLRKNDGPINRQKSSVAFLANSSGLVTCHVENDFGVAATSVHVNVSDKTEAFMVTITTELGETNLKQKKNVEKIFIVEGDDVTIQCWALDFIYKNLKLLPKEDGSTNCSTPLSSGRCLKKRDITVMEAETYECSTDMRARRAQESIRFQLQVYEKLIPTLLPESNVSEDGNTISVKASKPFSIACLVEGRPAPEITWLKDGVNIEKIPDYVDNKERVFLVNDRQVLEFRFAQREYEGQYMCNVENRVGYIQPYVNVAVQGVGLTGSQWLIVSIALVFLLFMFVLVIFLYRRLKKESKLRNELRKNHLYIFEKGNVGDLNRECTIDEQADLLPYDKSYEVEKERIKLGKQLGAGAFGRVMQADVMGLEVEGKPTRVAVKMCKDGTDLAQLRGLTLELKIMIHLGKHLNIVNLMGAHTENMDKGDLWILVEYCRYGNLLKFMQKCKSRFVNQVDHVTGAIDIHRMTPNPNDPMSPTSISRTSRTGSVNRPINTDADGYLKIRANPESESGSIRGGPPLVRNTSILSHTGSTTGTSVTSRPGLYVGNPHYTTAGFVSQSPTPQDTLPSNSPSGAPNYVTATQLPNSQMPSRHESTTSYPGSEGVYHMTLNTEMTGLSSPPPFSPSSTTSGDFFFDSQGNPITFDSGGIPGVSAPFTTTDLICWAWQIANGMEYLNKRKVLHGDLAARNILLAENNVVKISDFGLSREIYKNDIYMKKGDEIMPIKWMAPEAIQQKIFSTQSDVWAFGITIWEMFTLGNTPYPGIPLNQDFPIALENGMRMEKPKYCNEELYNLMLNCWNSNPVERPSFSRISKLLSDMLSPESRENYVSMNTVYVQKNEKWMQFNEDYLNMVSSPDFLNLQAPICEEGVDPSYIRMEAMKDFPDGKDPSTIGYLDMNTVRSSPAAPESLFSPRPPTGSGSQSSVFNFNGNEVPLTEDNLSPAETSNLLGNGNENGENEDTLKKGYHNNNNINKLGSFKSQQQPHYQNLEKVASTNKKNALESQPLDPVITNNIDTDDEILESDNNIDKADDDASVHYMNLPEIKNSNYVNTADIV